MSYITVSNIKIEVVKKDIKNLHLGVYPPAGRVRIAAPLNVKEDTVRLFAVTKLGWIKKNQRKFEGQDRLSEREYKNRESHYYEGRRYLLNIIETEAAPKVVIRNKTTIDLYISLSMTKLNFFKIVVIYKTSLVFLETYWEVHPIFFVTQKP